MVKKKPPLSASEEAAAAYRMQTLMRNPSGEGIYQNWGGPLSPDLTMEEAHKRLADVMFEGDKNRAGAK